jgi:hypothetical protein
MYRGFAIFALTFGLCLAGDPAFAANKRRLVKVASDPFAEFDAPRSGPAKKRVKRKGGKGAAKKQRTKRGPTKKGGAKRGDKLAKTGAADGLMLPPSAPVPGLAESSFDAYGSVELGVDYLHLPKEAPGRRDGSVSYAEVMVHAGTSEAAFQLIGRCATFGTDSQDPKPQMPLTEGRGSSCLLKEGFVQVSKSAAQLVVGKRVLDFSQSVLSSPANPSHVGLTLGSPFEKKEGISSVEVKLIPSSDLSFFTGVAAHEDLLLPRKDTRTSAEANPTEPSAVDLRREQTPPEIFAGYAGIGLGLETFAATAIVAKDFGGLAVNLQAAPFLIVYAEGNIYFPSRFADTRDVENDEIDVPPQSDALAGLSVSPPGSPLTLAVEYLHNSTGLSGAASAVRLLEAQRYRSTITRRDVYAFPVATSDASPVWGSSAFMSRNLLFVGLHTSEGDGPSASVLGSLDDRSARGAVGYTFKNEFPAFGGDWRLGVSWISHRGPEFSEFRTVGESIGREQIVISLKIGG